MQIDHKFEDQSPITRAPTWRPYLALFMSLTVTKESVLTMDRPHLYIISSNPLPFIIWPQMINSDVPM